jgi:hypothetical protein
MRKYLMGLGLAAVLAVSACAGGVTGVSGPYPAGSAYTLQLSRLWSDITVLMGRRGQNVRALTIDGPELNLLLVGHDIAPGAGLIRPARRDERLPVFRADMTSRELAEFVTESLTTLGYVQVEAESLAPADFAGRRGVSMRLRAVTSAGLNMVGQAAVTGQDGKMQVLIYMAAEEHFAALHQEAVDSLFASVISTPQRTPATDPAPTS